MYRRNLSLSHWGIPREQTHEATIAESLKEKRDHNVLERMPGNWIFQVPIDGSDLHVFREDGSVGASDILSSSVIRSSSNELTEAYDIVGNERSSSVLGSWRVCSRRTLRTRRGPWTSRIR